MGKRDAFKYHFMLHQFMHGTDTAQRALADRRSHRQHRRHGAGARPPLRGTSQAPLLAAPLDQNWQPTQQASWYVTAANRHMPAYDNS